MANGAPILCGKFCLFYYDILNDDRLLPISIGVEHIGASRRLVSATGGGCTTLVGAAEDA